MPKKSNSRPARWAKAAQDALTALEELKSLQDEYQEMLDNVSENLQSSPFAEKLTAVTELDLESALSTVQEADGIDLPLGFGRD